MVYLDSQNDQAGWILCQVHHPFKATKLGQMSQQMVVIVIFIHYQVIYSVI